MPPESAALSDPARRVLAAFDGNRQIAPLTQARPDLDLDAGYAIAAEVAAARRARGERISGRKIGFTNRTIWPIYNVHAPVWGWMYEATVQDLPDDGRVPLPALPEPRIEPEIAFGIARTPAPEMDDAALLDCLDWVAHGAEIVISLYPGWRFTAPDSVAAMAMHAAFWIGPRCKVTPERAAALAGCRVTLSGPGETVAGRGRDVLGGPLDALRRLLGETGRMPGAGPPAPGEVITTGTLTDARPVAPGQRWRTHLEGSDLPGLDIRFC